MKRDRLRHAVHCEVANDVATLWTGAFYAPALKRDSRKFLDIKKFCAAEMIVAFFDARIDAPYIDLRSGRGVLRMFAIDFDSAAKVRKLTVSRAEELMHIKPNAGARWIELVALLC